MGLEKVIKEILDAGRKESSRIVEEGKQKREETLAEARKKGNDEIEKKRKEAAEARMRRKTQEIAKSELEAKKTVLRAQKEILDLVYQKVMVKLGELPSNNSILKTLIERNMAEISNGRVFSNPRDESFVRSLVGDRYSEVVECLGGIVIESMDGTTKIDLRYETMMKDVWGDSIKDLSQILWGTRK